MDGVREEIGVYEDRVGRFKGRIVLEEERGRDLGYSADYFVGLGFLLRFLVEDLVLLESVVAFGDDPLHLVRSKYGNFRQSLVVIPAQTCVSSLRETF